jgi:hypothetical protein
VVVTSRWSAWSRHASSLPLDVLTRAESVAFLRRRIRTGDDPQLDALADLVGDLPLALEEAAAYLEETQDSLDAYLELVKNRSHELFGLDGPGQGRDGDQERVQRRVATVWSVSLDRIHTDAPAAEALLCLCAYLAPDIPRRSAHGAARDAAPRSRQRGR